MPYWTLGYGGLLLAIALSVWVARKERSRDPTNLKNEFCFVILYTVFSLVMFLHVPRIHDESTGNFDGAYLLDDNFQLALGVIALNGILQVLVLMRLSTLFAQMLVPALMNVVAWGAVLPLTDPGIINVVWMIIFTATLSIFIIVAAIFSGIESAIEASGKIHDSATRREVLNSIRAEANGLLKMGLTAFLALGASVGVSMSILFQGGDEAWGNPSNQLNATRLVIGFALVSLGLGLWLVRPYLNCFERTRTLYLSSLESE